jgi:hypothetical protein
MEKIKKYRDYEKILKNIRESKLIMELAMDHEKINRIKRFKEAGDFSEILKEFNSDIKVIVENCKDLYYDDIEYKIEDDICEIYYNLKISSLLIGFNYKWKSAGEDITDRLSETFHPFLEIEINDKLLNKIDIMNNLPTFMKNIGLGKKIYKKLIKDFNYISSYNGYDPSIDSSMVWNSLLKDEELFIFTNDDNIIAFWNEVSYENIVETLIEFYKNSGNIEFDDTFLDIYNLTEEKLMEIINGK